MSRASEERAARRASFRKAHADGMRAIKKADLAGLVDALRREGEVITAQAEFIANAKQAAGLPLVPQRPRRTRNST